MLWSLFFVLYGDVILALLAALSASFRSNAEFQMDDDSSFIKNADFMFPENFLSRYPHEANPYRLKIYAYLIFNLLVKGYGSVDPGRFWEDYNRDDYKRALIDAVFYEYLTNFTDREAKDILFDPLERNKDYPPVSIDFFHPPYFWDVSLYPPDSDEEVEIDRIGQYLDLLAETEPEQKRLKGAYEILLEDETSPTSEPPTDECETQKIQTSGVPGMDYPNFCDIPETSFSCAHKRIPGIYSDYQTGCQAFHVCWPHRTDSFLCPIGTTFNQSLLTCNIWHDTRCYSSPFIKEVNQFQIEGFASKMNIPTYDGTCESLLNKMLRLHLKFLPAKCEVKYINSKQVEVAETHETVVSELALKIDTAYDLVQEMLEIIREIREDMIDEIAGRGDAWIYPLEKRIESKSTPKFRAETANKAFEVTKKVGHFKSPKVTERLKHSGKVSPKMKPSYYVTRSIHLKPSKSLNENIKSSRKQAIPKIVMKSRLGSTILDEGTPVTKQMIIDSYRKIKIKEH
ncbi:U-scoloptoxin(01)-Cw1a like protein [Argiope bruennichi]|uniref:U-scoloptoxin(01)-Cw1a like protein n=1 Tax=Argiope bruennichi TaxID=94029 RepID=A0A8T0E7Q6_ARGBR|nr:U-scoloptoxin(01)-Cw1a like protein [Argiope bruennichi]